jgi:hypothetical protein
MKFIFVITNCVVMLWMATALAVQGVKVLEASKGTPLAEVETIGECSLGCAIGWDLTASSHIPDQGKVSYRVENLDGDGKKAWVVGGKNYGIGESVTFSFTRKHFKVARMKTVNFNGFTVVNGYAKNKKVWRENSRVKRLLIEHNDKPLYEVKLHDSMNVQDIDFTPFYIKAGDTVKVTILDVYSGDKFKDTALSVLIPMGAH